MAARWNPPPTWPAPPPGWRPPAGWVPNPDWGPPPPGWPLWVEQRSWIARNRAVVVVLALLLVLGGGAVAGTAYYALRPPPTVALGTPVTDGDIEFTVTAVDCGLPTLGSGYRVQEAEGTFCVVRLTARNTSRSTASVGDFGQKLVSTTGEQYDSSYAGYGLDDHLGFESINPGLSKSGSIVFDVPTGVTIAAVELHDDFSGKGARVTVP